MNIPHASENIASEIKGIKVAGVASIAYWSIIVTDTAIYFLNHGSNYLPLGPGALVDVYKSAKARAGTDLTSRLSSSKRYYRIPKNKITNTLSWQKKMLSTLVSFQDDDKIISIKLNGKQMDQFKAGLDQLGFSA